MESGLEAGLVCSSESWNVQLPWKRNLLTKISAVRNRPRSKARMPVVCAKTARLANSIEAALVTSWQPARMARVSIARTMRAGPEMKRSQAMAERGTLEST